jgi:RNAse (barnase) inhibitor barstar
VGTVSEVLKDSESAGVYALSDAALMREIEEAARELKYAFFPIQGGDIRNKDDFLNSIARVMDFPDYFGANWDALEDCLTDLLWVNADGYVIAYKDVSTFASGDPDGFATALDIFRASAEHWRSQGRGFFVLLAGAGAEGMGLPSIGSNRGAH